MNLGKPIGTKKDHLYSKWKHLLGPTSVVATCQGCVSLRVSTFASCRVSETTALTMFDFGGNGDYRLSSVAMRTKVPFRASACHFWSSKWPKIPYQDAQLDDWCLSCVLLLYVMLT